MSEILKTTTGICPLCRQEVPAFVEKRDVEGGREEVWMERCCEGCGGNGKQNQFGRAVLLAVKRRPGKGLLL